ncbi:hypothetical protein SAMN04488058_11342 [Deinococcus reticulitermitis]|uniref:BNR repeat-containing family member n=1 Tax=Deinococcus reticulitermitis TaxID=856736 RepID=A0A1H7AVD8_9DEIO|nr:hypothetical protein [Deinococcus reticulitermitis]SEJ65820.1 hypothetical protein SAMN04488058_11342 [Deinococcus reticulitermitis]
MRQRERGRPLAPGEVARTRLALVAFSVVFLALVALAPPQVRAGGGEPVAGRFLPGPATVPGRPLQTAAITDATGALVVAWIQREGSGSRAVDRLYAARFAGGAWRLLGGMLNEDAWHNASRLQAARGPEGEPWLGWAEDAGSAHVDSTLLSRWDGAGWSDPARFALRRNLSDAGKASAFAVLPDGQPLMLWTNLGYPGAAASVVQAYTREGRSWNTRSTPLNVRLQDAASWPCAAVTPDGTSFAVWLEGDGATSQVYAARRAPGGAWRRLGSALNVHPRTYTAGCALQVTARGQPVVAWLEDRNGTEQVFVKRWTGRVWQALGESLNARSGQPAERPALALDQSGDPVVAWAEGTEGRRQVYARRWTGERWRLLSGAALSRDPRHDAHSPSVTLTPSGGAFVVWAEGPSIQVRSFSAEARASRARP